MPISQLKNIKRVIGCRFGNDYELRNLTADEIKRVGNVIVQRDTECNWFSRTGGGGWNTLLVVLD